MIANMNFVDISFIICFLISLIIAKKLNMVFPIIVFFLTMLFLYAVGLVSSSFLPNIFLGIINDFINGGAIYINIVFFSVMFVAIFSVPIMLFYAFELNDDEKKRGKE